MGTQKTSNAFHPWIEDEQHRILRLQKKKKKNQVLVTNNHVDEKMNKRLLAAVVYKDYHYTIYCSVNTGMNVKVVIRSYQF